MSGRGQGRPFVGREGELATLLRRLADARQGEGGVALVAGEPGIGKTRLLAELGERARAGGWVVASGRAYDSEGMPPYLPFVEALRGFVRGSSPDRLRAQLGRGAAEVALLVPELRELLPDLAAPPPLSPEQERYRLFEAVCDVLDAIARGGETGLLMVLDDLHWADAPTLQLLQHLGRRLAGAPLLVVAAYRTTEAEPSRAFTETLAALAREGAPASLVLARLTFEETAALVAGFAGGAAAAAVADAIQRTTEGNPFFIGEVVRHLQAEGRDLHDPDAAGGAFAVPDLVRQVIAARLGRLRPATHALLRQGAVLGDGFAFAVARAASGLEEDVAVEAIEEALAAGMLRQEGDAYHFAHALIRRTLYDALSVPRRQRLHLRAAEAIGATHGRTLDPHLRELVAHYRLAGGAADPEMMLDLYRRAGDAATAVFAWEEAAVLRGEALGLLPAERQAERVELLLAMGDAHRNAGDQRFREAFGRAAALAREADVPEWLARAALGLGGAGFVHGVTDRALIELLREALVAVGPDDGVIRSRLLARLALELRFDEVRDRSTALSREAEAMARRVGDAQALGLALLAKIAALQRPEQQDEQLAATDALVQFARDTGDRERILWANDQTWFNRMRLDDIARVDAVLVESERIARELRHSYFLWWTANAQAMRALLAGELASCEQLAARALALAQPSQRHAALGASAHTWQLVALRREQGRTAEILADATRVAEQSPAFLDWQGLLSILHCELGRYEEAARLLGSIMSRDLAGLDLFNPSQTLGLVAEACHALGDQPHAATLYTLLRDEDGRVIRAPPSNPVYQGAVARHLGLLATTLGWWDDAARHFEDALAMHARMGARPLLAHTQRQYAAMLLGRRAHGDLPRARALLEEAICTYEQLGMVSWAAQARDLLAASGHVSGARSGPAASVYPDGLTEREIEVLGLLAQGKSNAEIADVLVISVHTVIRHANHIFAKLGVQNRTEAAAYAHRHGLA